MEFCSKKENDLEKISKNNPLFKLTVGDKVLVKIFSNNKLDSKFEGPFLIYKLDLENHRLQVENQHHLRWESLRNIKPYFTEEGECHGAQ